MRLLVSSMGLFLFSLAPLVRGQEREDFDEFSSESTAETSPFWGAAPGTLGSLLGMRETSLGREAYGLVVLRWPLGGPPPGNALSLRRSNEEETVSDGFGANLSRPGDAEVLRAEAKTGEGETSEGEPPFVVIREERASASVEGASAPSADPGAVCSSGDSATDAPLPRFRIPRGLLKELRERVEREATARSALGQLEALSGRARLSGLVPELRLRGAHGLDQSVSPATTGVYGAEPLTRDGWDTAVEARLTFHLDRLVYDDAEATLQRQAAQERALRDKRVADALETFFRFWEVGRRLAYEELEPEARLQLEILSAVLEARLDAATGGELPRLLRKFPPDASPRRACGRGEVPTTESGPALPAPSALGSADPS